MPDRDRLPYRVNLAGTMPARFATMRHSDRQPPFEVVLGAVTGVFGIVEEVAVGAVMV